jgi:hypothetical protein
MWWPGESYVSCDGHVTLNTGAWVREGGRSVGYFTTGWSKQNEGEWKWAVGHGEALATPRPAGKQAKHRHASCVAAPDAFAVMSPDLHGKRGEGRFPDRSIVLMWSVREGDKTRSVSSFLWNGRDHEQVIHDRVGHAEPQ